MEQHPVPQNVTTFQFRLIGDMTLKQFGYLCAGGILAFVAYKLPLPFFFTWPSAVGFALLGIGFAFVPIEERPMDVWVFSFFKSIYSPTQYIWTQEAQKPPQSVAPKTPVAAVAQPTSTHQAPITVPSVTGHAPVIPTPPVAKPPATTQLTPAQATQVPSPSAPTQTPKAQIISGLFTQTSSPKPAQGAPAAPHASAQTVARHQSWWEQLLAWFKPAPKPAPQHTPPQPARMVPSVTGKHIEQPKSAVQPQQNAVPAQTQAAQDSVNKLEQTVKSLQTQLSTQTQTSDRIVELQKQLTEVLTERTKMQDELAKLRRQMDANEPTPPQTAPPTQSQTSGPTVSVIKTQDAAVKVGLPRLTSVPNVIAGIIKDDTNNFLPGILVTVLNHEGIPMRALKTNKLGQFAASTPLPNDTYKIEAEDPRSRFTFDKVQITLNGSVLPAIEVVAKSQKQLTREKLTQEIFGKPQL